MHPILFKIGNFPIHSFGVMMIVAFMAGLWLASQRASRFGLTKEQTQDIALWTLIGGVLGARVLFIVQEIPYYSKHPAELYSFQFQGLTSFGGLLAGVGVIAGYAKWRKISPVTLMDLFGPCFLLGHVFGRIGCLLNGCCYGPACAPGDRFGVHVDGLPDLHVPAQLYDSLMTLAGLLFLLWIERRGFRPGQALSATLVAYGASRFVYEFWRAGVSSTKIAGLPLTEAHVVALSLVLVGAGLFLFYGSRSEAAPRMTEA